MQKFSNYDEGLLSLSGRDGESEFVLIFNPGVLNEETGEYVGREVYTVYASEYTGEQRLGWYAFCRRMKFTPPQMESVAFQLMTPEAQESLLMNTAYAFTLYAPEHFKTPKQVLDLIRYDRDARFMLNLYAITHRGRSVEEGNTPLRNAQFAAEVAVNKLDGSEKSEEMLEKALDKVRQEVQAAKEPTAEPEEETEPGEPA